MSNEMYPKATREIAQKRRDLAPKPEAAFQAFSQAVFADGALSGKTKQLIAVAVAHVTQCPYCIQGHTKQLFHLARKSAIGKHGLAKCLKGGVRLGRQIAPLLCDFTCGLWIHLIAHHSSP